MKKCGSLGMLLLLLLSLPIPSLAMEAALAPFIDYIVEASIPMEALPHQPADYAGLDEYDILLIGEHHGTQKTYQAEEKMIEFAVLQQGIRHLALEIGYCDAQLINAYVVSGDRNLLQTILENLAGTSSYTEENDGFYQWLYALNQRLPAGDGLKVYGMDVQHQADTGLFYLSRLLPPGEAPEALSLLDTLRSASFSPDMIPQLRENLAVHAADYQAYLGDGYASFIKGVESIETGLAYYASSDDAYREQCLIDHFIEAYEEQPGVRWIGVFGGAHTALNAQGANLGSYLAHHYEGTAAKVGSISIVYTNSQSMNPSGGAPLPVEEMPLASLVGDLLEGDLSFCPLDAPQSPFGKGGDQSLESQQYLIIITNSPPANRYGQSTGA